MKKMMLFMLIAITSGLCAQEILLSPNELYYDFLSLGGFIERPYLNYRTLSDSTWETSENTNGIWSGVNLGTKKNINEKIGYKIYGPELFTSYNTGNAYGQNDSTLWQGKGFNLLVNGGARLELYGFELTLRPEFAFTQNSDFSLVEPDPAYSSWKEASQYGYYGVAYVDAPQRFGDGPYYEFSWGDSEIRYSWKTLTMGFGTQNIWLGPAKINPLLLSNNAPPWPKLDMGIRRQPITIPKFNWYIGDIEARVFWGMLSESEFFDDDDSNDHNLITGLSLAYSFPHFLKGLTIGYNRVMLSKWDDFDYTGLLTLIVPQMDKSAGKDERDQRASLTFSYLFPKVGFEIYLEWAKNDFSPQFDYVLKYPFHTQAYTVGARKNFLFRSDLQGELLFEFTNLESSRDYEFFAGNTTWYAHHIITQGHTNRGQWLGSGLGTGGDSQYLGFTLFYKKGFGNIFFQRQGVDSDYIWFMAKGKPIDPDMHYNRLFKTLLSVGVSNYINIYKYLGIYTGLTYTHILDPTYDYTAYPRSNNVYISIGVKAIY